MKPRPVAYHNYTREELPTSLTIKDEETGETLWSTIIEGVGAVEVPGFAPRKVLVIEITANGFKTTTNSKMESFTMRIF